MFRYSEQECFIGETLNRFSRSFSSGVLVWVLLAHKACC